MKITIDKNDIEVFYREDIYRFYHDSKKNDGNNLTIGESYALLGVDCDDFKTEDKVYRVEAIINDFNKFPINCAVVTQTDGPMSTVFEIPRNLCKEIGIEYHPRLQLLPLSLNWVHVKNENSVEFNPNDISTYDIKDGYITVMFKLKGFTERGKYDASCGYSKRIHHSSGYFAFTDLFIQLLQENDFTLVLRDTRELFGATFRTDHGFEDSEGKILVVKRLAITKETLETLKGVSPIDYIPITWYGEKEKESKRSFSDARNDFNRLTNSFPKFSDGIVRQDDFGNFEIMYKGRWKSIARSSVDGKLKRMPDPNQMQEMEYATSSNNFFKIMVDLDDIAD